MIWWKISNTKRPQEFCRNFPHSDKSSKSCRCCSPFGSYVWQGNSEQLQIMHKKTLEHVDEFPFWLLIAGNGQVNFKMNKCWKIVNNIWSVWRNAYWKKWKYMYSAWAFLPTCIINESMTGEIKKCIKGKGKSNKDVAGWSWREQFELLGPEKWTGFLGLGAQPSAL